MRFFSPWALGFLSFLPLVVLMYILKQRFEEREVSSTYLWRQVLMDIDVNTPWQKLKKNLLLILQLLCITLLVFALADPFITMGGGTFSDVLLIVDNTGSMNYSFGDSTRLEKAKKLAEEVIKNAGRDTAITLISSGRKPKIEVSRTRDKGEALARLRAIKPTREAGDIHDSLSLVKALSKQLSNYRGIFYTDEELDLTDIRGEVVSLASRVQNASLDYIAHASSPEGLQALVRITNRGDEPLDREISVYGEGRLLDIKSVSLAPGETKTVFFSLKAQDINYIKAELSEEDALAEDNTIYHVVNLSRLQKVLLISERNVFLERALSSMKNIELYKTNPKGVIAEDYDLYIFDGNMPEKLPTRGSLLLVNPSANNPVIEVISEVEGGLAEVKKHGLTKYMEGASFVVSKLKKLELPYWANPVITIGKDKLPGAAAGEYRNRKIAVIAFDLHHSDFILTPEYPIFVHNLMEFLIDMGSNKKNSYFSGEGVEVSPQPDTKEAFIKLPNGKTKSISLKYPMLPFENTDELGIYELVQKSDDKVVKSYLAVNYPTDKESRVGRIKGNKDNDVDVGAASPMGRRIMTLLIVFLLGFAVIEWVVYIRGY